MGGTVLPILVQSLVIRGTTGATATEFFSAGPAISAVDLTKSYIFIPAHESGIIGCDGTFGAVGPNESCRRDGNNGGFNTDGQVQQFCVELTDPVTARTFRQGAPGPLPAGPPGCGASWEKVLVVEHT